MTILRKTFRLAAIASFVLLVLPAAKGGCGPDVPIGGDGDCGGPNDIACGSGEYCDFGSTCGEGDQLGTCAPIPDACTEPWIPVCGCDGQTYGTACAAAAEGMSVAHDGECNPSPTVCGFGGEQCPSGQFCDYALADQCGAADQTGLCQPIPQACNDIYQPVCGCDGQTYGNSCDANANGVSVAAEGECQMQGTVCGGLAAIPCAFGEFCYYAPGDGCGFDDGTGICQTLPQGCTEDCPGVCGCDGQDYCNECQANAMGVSVASSGACQ
ncbi:MAG: Kazal-type serine protease inhibitor domain-containing protein [Polyangiaceae bacterium]